MAARQSMLAFLTGAGLLAMALPVLGVGTGSDEVAEAIVAQRREVAARPEDPATWNDLGNLLVLGSQEGAALEAYQQALALDPQRDSAHYNLALLLHRRGELAAALDHYEVVVELHPRHAWAHYQMGRIHEANGQREAAIEDYAAAFGLDPTLAFADVNPYVIDNGLLTEALLSARRESTRDWAPRDYDEPERITNLLAPPVAQERPSGRGKAGVPRAAGESPGGSSRTPPATSPADAGGSAAPPRSVPRPTEPPAEQVSPPTPVSVTTPRTAGEPPSRTGATPAPPPASAPARRRAGARPPPPSVRSTPEPTTTPTEGEPGRPSRFRPGPRSSAQLTPRLVPVAGSVAAPSP